MILLPNLLLQKSALKASNNINKVHIERKFKLWKDGNVKTLLSEYITIQHLLSNNDNNTDEKYISKTFAHFIKLGNINRALRLISENPDNGKLDLSEDVLQELKLKHPKGIPKCDGL